MFSEMRRSESTLVLASRFGSVLRFPPDSPEATSILQSLPCSPCSASSLPLDSSSTLSFNSSELFSDQLLLMPSTKVRIALHASLHLSKSQTPSSALTEEITRLSATAPLQESSPRTRQCQSACSTASSTR